MMLAAQNRPLPAQNEPPRQGRGIADNWRGLYGSVRFSSMKSMVRNRPPRIRMAGRLPVVRKHHA
jgi:hypothetical protein